MPSFRIQLERCTILMSCTSLEIRGEITSSLKGEKPGVKQNRSHYSNRGLLVG